MIKTAQRTLVALEQASFPVGVAMLVPEESGNWFLYIYSGLVDLSGPRVAYRRLLDATLQLAEGLPLDQIRLLPFSRQEARAISKSFSIGVGSDVTLRNLNLDGVFIEDAVLLRTFTG